MKKKKFGIFNVSASENIKLIDLKNYLNLNKVKFSNYEYITPKIDNTKAKKLYANLKLTTYQNIKKYLKSCKKKIHKIKGKSLVRFPYLEGSLQIF